MKILNRMINIKSLVFLFIALLLISGCVAKGNTPAAESQKNELPKNISDTFFKNVLLFKPSKIVEIVKRGESSNEKMTVFLTTHESSMSVIQFYRTVPLENDLRIIQEFDVSEGTIIILGKNDKEIASVAIFGSKPTKIVIEYYKGNLKRE